MSWRLNALRSYLRSAHSCCGCARAVSVARQWRSARRSHGSTSSGVSCPGSLDPGTAKSSRESHHWKSNIRPADDYLARGVSRESVSNGPAWRGPLGYGAHRCTVVSGVRLSTLDDAVCHYSVSVTNCILLPPDSTRCRSVSSSIEKTDTWQEVSARGRSADCGPALSTCRSQPRRTWRGP